MCARQIALRHQARSETGALLFQGWPRYVEGILNDGEMRAVEERDAEVFAWHVRRPKIVQTVLSLDADLVSLVELDQYESFFRGAFENAGYGSLWMKRPRPESADGCAILYKKNKMELIASHGFSYHDDLHATRRDRVALMALFSVKHGCQGEDNRILFVSTHLARNPENEQQTLVRIRQVCELMLELRKFASSHDCMHVPVVVAGDWNAGNMQRLRFMALALFSLQSLVHSAHPLLLGGMDVPTSKTSFTLHRRSRIDYLMYQETLLRPTARGPADADIAGVWQKRPTYTAKETCFLAREADIAGAWQKRPNCMAKETCFLVKETDIAVIETVMGYGAVEVPSDRDT